MTTSFAFVFPGQGSQSLNMMAGFPDSAEVQSTFAEASSVLGFDLWKMLLDGPEAVLNQTVNTQPLMLAAGVATYRVWQALGGPVPALLAGHSLGEYSALVAAGSLAFSDAVALVRFRAEAMQNAVAAGEGAMAAILGLDGEPLQQACAEAAQGQVLAPVNFNSPGQVVIAGHRTAVERGIEVCKARGAKRALLLPVSVPSHCALMLPAAEQLQQRLQQVLIQAPQIPVLHNADVNSYNEPEQIRDALVRQLYSPVRWVETVQQMAATGIQIVAECGPGKVLAGLGKRISSDVRSPALVDMAALLQLRDELKGAGA
jgi:[acyl-carrier-protein] S-malonyltransferase